MCPYYAVEAFFVSYRITIERSICKVKEVLGGRVLPDETGRLEVSVSSQPWLINCVIQQKNKDMKNNNKLAMSLLGAAIVASVGTGLIGVASADSTVAANSSAAITQSVGAHRGPGPGVAGTVVSVSGNTITLTGKDGKTYTIDATKSTIDKISTITVGNIAAGDTLMVGGTVSGTSVTATHITDGQMPTSQGGGFGGPRGAGQGHSGVTGTVSAISGNTLTVANKAGTSYSVNASGATILKAVSGAKPATSTLASVAIGDTVRIQGTISGTSVTATRIVDGVLSQRPVKGSTTSSQTSAQQ